MRVCVLQPSYEGSACDYQYYDPPRHLSALVPEHEFHHEFVKKVSAFSQVQARVREGFDIFVNLCEGYRDSDVASIDVIHALEHFNVPFTGPTSALYDPPKPLMKFAARTAGVATPQSVVIGRTPESRATAGGAVNPARGGATVEDALAQLRFPMFVKPAAYGDSMGIDDHALVRTEAELRHQVGAVSDAFGAVLVEEYIAGREFTVLLCARPGIGEPPHVLTPLEFLFPPGTPFKTYDLKVRQFHPESNVLCTEPALAATLKAAAEAVFRAFAAEGYARMDFRVGAADRVFFLEVNFACSVLYPEGYQGSADYIVQQDGLGQAGFLRAILDEGLARHARRQRAYAVRPCNGSDAIFAARSISAGEVVFHGEERAQRIVSRGHVERTWSEADRETFYRYAWPVGPDIYVLWDLDPANWAPQNHACEPNTVFHGLNVVARRDIVAGEELTLDYADCYDHRMIPFDCHCGSPSCRGRITGGRA